VTHRRQAVAGSLDALIAEIQAYLSVVDAFRREGCEPCWRLEPTGVGKELP
jgi:hypothetical protein